MLHLLHVLKVRVFLNKKWEASRRLKDKHFFSKMKQIPQKIAGNFSQNFNILEFKGKLNFSKSAASF